MDFSYSPTHSHETLQLSPTHLHDVNPLIELRNLRRSMSRSPSKFTRSSTRSPLNSPLNSPASASPLSPLRQSSAALQTAPLARHSSSDDNLPSSSRKPRPGRPALTRATPIRGLFKTAQAQAQAQAQVQSTPADHRALRDSSDFGNGSPQSSQESTVGRGKYSMTPDGSPLDTFENVLLQSKPRSIPIRTPSTRSRAPAVADKDVNPSRDWAPAKSSPLKRSDGSLTSRDPGVDSPSAKRRSLNGATFDSTRDFDDANHLGSEQLAAGEEISPDEAAFRATLPPSAFGAFRKTLFHNKMSPKPGANRNRRSLESGTSPATPKRTNTRPRPRTSMDSALSARELGDVDKQIFDGASPSPEFQRPSHNTRSTRQHPHPLSRALSPNSPNPSLTTQGESRVATSTASLQSDRPSIFSKSLPAGALRPQEPRFVQGAENSSFETPKPFEVARPDPAAFRSTGLISKRHRNPDDLPPPPNGRAGMPDTPCKKANVGLAIASSPGSISSIAKPRFEQPSFGTPSRPFNLHGSRPVPPNAFSKSVGYFDKGKAQPSFDRRASFTSVDGDDLVQSPSRGRDSLPDSQSSADELPPTPTKPHSSFVSSKASSLRSSLFGRRPAVAVDTFATPDAPKESLFSRSRNTGDRVPQTPIADGGIPDPSFLSISPSNKTPLSPVFRGSFGSSIGRTPATPSHRDSTNSNLMAGSVATPSHHASHQNVDPVLSLRFKRVEWYARGEFSDVFKVFQQSDRSNYFSPTGTSRAQSTPLPDKVYMVKKSRVPHHSAKLRDKLLREPDIMRALGKSDHTVFLMDHWEANHYLYMQTEFCEEGTLSDFLLQQGREGRLDDFRIWKILIEVSLGVKHIHDNGFIHLDLKPENVFIDFEGILKIGDFGLASQWPAPNNIEGEGDRRYIGPDLLLGAFDKPADIFALGMIMYEIAANFIPPDNGGWWQKLRSGDFSGLPSLTSSDSLVGDSSGHFNADANLGLETSRSNDSLFSPASDTVDSRASIDTRMTSWNSSISDKPHSPDTELAQPPAFMLDPTNKESLDNIVHWMMLPDPSARPVIDQVLAVAGCEWVSGRRRSGAVIYEGRWGPADHMLPAKPTDEDSIMTDV